TLQPERRELVRALLQAADYIARAASWRPSLSGARLATEVDLALCFLDAAYEDLDPAEDMLKQERGDLLALRIDRAVDAAESGVDQPAEPFQPWMAELLGLPAPTESVFQTLYELEHEGHPFQPAPPVALTATFATPVRSEPVWVSEPEPGSDLPRQADPFLSPEAAAHADEAPQAPHTLDAPRVSGDDASLSELEPDLSQELGPDAEPALESPSLPAPALHEEARVPPAEAAGPGDGEDEVLGLSAGSVPADDVPSGPVPELTQALTGEPAREAFLAAARQAVHAGLDVVAAQLASMFDTDAEAGATPDGEGGGPLAQAFVQLAQVANQARSDDVPQAGELADAVDVLLPFLSGTGGGSARPEELHLALEALHQIGLWVEDVASGRAPEALVEALRQATTALAPSAPLPTPSNNDIDMGGGLEEPALDLAAIESSADVAPADGGSGEVLAPATPVPEPRLAEAVSDDDHARASTPDSAAPGDLGEPQPFRQTRFVDGEAPFKQVGPLRLPLADYKAFLNEADE
ncbi:hypothetical protein P3G55_24525, partial [Leptospira sp. 96542]|nr:hypothetical protein [Leptospira sp. 96542]